MTVQDNLRLGAFLRREGTILDDMKRAYDNFPVLKDRRTTDRGDALGW